MARLTIAQEMVSRDERTTGFDYLRVGLAVMVVVWHTCIVCYGGSAQTALAIGWSRPLWTCILPMFFSLSGFLVAGSLERSKTLISFLGLRAIRLLPALIVESMLAVLVLGLLATALPKAEYLRQHETWSYLRNIAGGLIGGIQYRLPGVFRSNPTTAVNFQLWTLPWELWSYISISALVVFYQSKRALILCLIAGQAGVYMADFFLRPVPDIGLLSGWSLVMSFLYGIALYRFRRHIPLRASWAISALILAAFLLSFRATSSSALLPAAYLTVWLGLQRPKVIWPLTTGDYSYPIFLYGFPIQQAVSAAFPWSREPALNFALAIVPLSFIAVLSWHWIELPVSVRARPVLFNLERWLTQKTWTRAPAGPAPPPS